MSSGQQEKSTSSNHITRWQKLVDFFSAAAEASNVGIVLQTAGQWVPAIAGIFAINPLSYLILIPERLIYFFRALAALTKVVGRTFFNIRFREEKIKSHPLQTVGDLLCVACFALAVAFFVGALVAPPLNITLAWLMGLAGMGCSSYFNYRWPEKQAKLRYEDLGTDESYQEYKKLSAARHWYMCALAGVSVLLLCGSAVAMVSPTAATVLTLISNTASLFLIGVAALRFRHWVTAQQGNPKKSILQISTASANEQIQQIQQIRSAPALDQTPLPRPRLAHSASAPALGALLIQKPKDSSSSQTIKPSLFAQPFVPEETPEFVPSRPASPAPAM